MSCPPKSSRSAAQSCSALTMEMPSMLRPLPFPMPVFVEADDDRRTMIALLQPRRDDADDAPVPVRAREDDAPVARRIVRRSCNCASACRSVSISTVCRSRLLRFSSERDGIASARSSVCEQPQRAHGIAKPAAGVEARPEPETDILRRDRKADLADLDQRAQAGPARVLELPQIRAAPARGSRRRAARCRPRCRARRDRDNRAGRSRAPPSPSSLSRPWQTLKTSPTLAR